MKRTLTAVVLITVIPFCSPGKTCGQGDVLGQNLYLFSLSPHTDFPDIVFSHNGWGSTLRFSNGIVDLFNDAGDRPLRINRNAAHGVLNVASTGVLIGSGAFGGALSIFRTDSYDFPNAKILAVDATSVEDARTMLELRNNGPVRFELGNDATGQTWAFQTNYSDGFLINRYGSGGNEFSIRKNGLITMGPGGKLNFVLDPVGNLRINGTLTQSSDREKKTAFEDVDGMDLLDRVRRIPIQSWRYKEDPKDVRHIGPVAQDFFREFNVGKDDKTIAAVDADGVALVAIQALAAQMEDLIREKDRQICDLEDRIAELESRLLDNEN